MVFFFFIIYIYNSRCTLLIARMEQVLWLVNVSFSLTLPVYDSLLYGVIFVIESIHI